MNTLTAIACGIVGVLIVLRLRWLVKSIGWSGLRRELRRLGHV